MEYCQLSLQFDRESRAYNPVEKVTGKILIDALQDCTGQGLLLSRQWRTHGRGNPANGRRVMISYLKSSEGKAGSEWKAGQRYEYDFEFTTGQGPKTYHGHYLYLDWYLQVTAELSWTGGNLRADGLNQPSFETDYILQAGQEPMRLEQLRASKDYSQSMAIASMILLLVGIGVLGHAVWQARSLQALWSWGLIPAFVGGMLLLYSAKNALALLRLGTVEVHIQPGLAEHTLLGTIRIRPRRTIDLVSIRLGLTVREEVTKGSGSTRNVYKHLLANKHTNQSQKLVAHQSFEMSLVLEYPEDLPSPLMLEDNEIVWEVKFEVNPRNWFNWSRTLKISASG